MKGNIWRSMILVLLVLAGTVYLGGCGGSSSDSSPASLTAIEITPANVTVAKGSTRQFTANGRLSNGGSQDMTTQVTWKSSNTGVATIAVSGLATAANLGTTTISAVYSGSTGTLTGTTKLTVSSSVSSDVNLPATGQTAVYATSTTYDDGKLQRGVAWPNPRFANPDGSTPISGNVVLDRLTGLIWTADANTSGPSPCASTGSRVWQKALDFVACLNTNSYLGYADWRLPNRNEMRSLVNYGKSNPASWLMTQGFTNVQPFGYWTSTSYANGPSYAWYVDLSSGKLLNGNKTNSSGFIWPVRSGR